MIQTHVLEGQTPGPHILIIAGVHGDEWEGMAAIRRLKTLISLAELHGKITLAPIVNFPAFELSSRCGPDELNLARICPGDDDGLLSHQIAREVSSLIKGADFLVDLHTGGTVYQVFPLAGYQLVADQAVLEVQRRMAKAFGLPLVWGTWAGLNGRTLSVARDAKVPAIYCEYLGGAFSHEGVEAYVQGCLNVLVELEMLPESHRKVEQMPRIVEDNRENAGHLQVHHLSPFAGFFEPFTRLGEVVRAGQELGLLWDGTREEPILAGQSGEILTLRVCARVEAGEMLAVILEDL